MAEFHFWGAEDDRNEIINSLLALGDYQLLPDLHYPDPSPRAYIKPELGLFEALANKKRLYVLGPYSKCPVFMEELNRGRDDGSFYISEARGGPVLSLTVPGHKIVDGIVQLAPGNFSRRSEYWDNAITTPTKASDELKQHYEKILGEIRRHLARKKVVQSIWIGPQAWQLLNEGKAVILSKGKWWNVKGDLIKSNL